MLTLRNHVKHWRKLRGLTQQELAQQAKVTRQTVSGVESGATGVGMEVALRMSKALGCRLEEIFDLDEGDETVWAASVGTSSSRPERVALAEIGGRTVARSLEGLGAYRWPTAAAHGIARPQAGGAGVEVERLSPRGQGLFLVGCDPALGLLAGYVGHQRDGVQAYWWHAGNTRAMEQLVRREAHLAAVHGPAEHVGTPTPMTAGRFRLAAWEMGWMVQPGNPKSFRDSEDLARQDLTLANREPGSGARRLLDDSLTKAGIPTSRVAGYQKEFAGHMEVARAVALGLADVGVGLAAAAAEQGLGFIPIVAEVSDIWVPSEQRDNPAVVALLEALNDGAFRQDLAAFGPYDTTETGKEISSRAA